MKLGCFPNVKEFTLITSNFRNVWNVEFAVFSCSYTLYCNGTGILMNNGCWKLPSISESILVYKHQTSEMCKCFMLNFIFRGLSKQIVVILIIMNVTSSFSQLLKNTFYQRFYLFM